MTNAEQAERRGKDTVNCATLPLPPISFAKLEAARSAELDPAAPVHALGRFATLVYIERYQSDPSPEDTVSLRANDDLAIAAMFEMEHPGIYDKVVAVFHQLDLIENQVPDAQPTA